MPFNRSRRFNSSAIIFLIVAVLFSSQFLPAARAGRASRPDEALLPAYEPLPDFDIRRLNKPARADRKKLSIARKATGQGDLALRWNDELDLPHHVFSATTPLTRGSSDDAEDIAKRFVLDNPGLFHLSRSEINQSRVSARSVDELSRFTRIALEQRVAGVRVFDSEMLFIIDPEGRIVSESGSFIPALESPALNPAPRLSPEDALRRGADSCGASLTAAITSREDNLPARRRTVFSSEEIDERTEASLVYYPITQTDVKLAYQVLLYGAPTPADSYLLIVDAATGRLLRRDSLTFMLGPSARVFTDKDPLVSGARAMVALGGNQTASPQGWVTDNRTAGNNTETYINTNLSGGSAVEANAEGNFDFPIDLAPGRSPIASANASATNLFYWVNVAHDKFYALGFTESSRNFQADNLNRGGRGGDSVRAETLRGASLTPSQTGQLVRNNAYFQTSLEGSKPLLAMLLWNVVVDGQSVELDSSYDAGVIIHEYTHGVSTRLSGTDNSIGLRSSQGNGMGEGWSDFFAHSFLLDGLPLEGAYPAGVYLTRRERGIRVYPYSTSFASDPLTFGDIEFNSEVHAQGTVWCSMLWDLRQAFVERYGLEAGRDKAERLVINGLKFLPLIPTFIDGRDAILLADRQTGGGANQDLIWRAFARRGLGWSADTTLATPSEGFHIRAAEGYDLAPEISAGSIVINDKPPTPAVLSETLPVVVVDRDLASQPSVEVSAKNLATGATATYTLQSTAPGRFAGSLLVLPQIADGSPGAALAAQPGNEIVISYQNARNEQGAAETLETRTVAGRRVAVYSYDFEQGEQDWTLLYDWHMTERRAASGTRSLYFARKKGANEKKSYTRVGSVGPAYSPVINLDGMVKPRLEFDYYFSGALTGTTGNSSGDIVVLSARNYAYTQPDSPVGGEPPLALAFDIRPQPLPAFSHTAIDLGFIGIRRAALFFNFTASQADIFRKKMEGFYMDNVRITAISTE